MVVAKTSVQDAFKLVQQLDEEKIAASKEANELKPIPS